MAAIDLHGVSKWFGTVQALSRLDLGIEDGEFLVLVGPSGCGKSTALRIVAGLEEAGEGEVRIGGEPVGGCTPGERNVAFVFQSYALYPHLTVAGNLAFPLRMRRVPQTEVRQKVEWAADLLGITGFLDRKPRALSGGQRQRVALGRAIVREPRAFLMDEPLSNLDAKLRVEMRSEIKQLQRRLGTTTLYVTHDQVEAMTMGDRVAVLRDGVLQQVGPPREVYEQPANLFVAGFMGSPPMNLLAARYLDIPDGPSLGLAGTEWFLGEADTVRLREAPAERLLAGIRPDAVTIGTRAGSGPDQVALSGRVTGVEYLGGGQVLHLEAGPEQITAVLGPGQRVAEGENVKAWVRRSAVHLFDRASERYLGRLG